MWAFLALLPVSSALFFGGGSSCGCGAPPACPPPAPPPVCAPAITQPCPVQPACGGGYGGAASFAQPAYQPQPFQSLAPAFNNYNNGPLAPLAPAAPVLNQGFAQPVQSYAPQLPLAPQAPIAPQTPIAPQPLPQAIPQPVYPSQAIAQPQVAPQIQVQPQAAPVAPTIAESGSYQQAPQPEAVQPAQQTQENYQTQTTEVQPAQEIAVAPAEEGAQYKEEGSVAVAAAASKNAEVIEEAIVKNKSEGKSKKEGTEEKGEDKPVDISQLKLTDDPLCNSDDLRNLMLENMDDNLNSSKRLIQLAAEAQFGGRFDVICANGDFSYVTNTELYCQETKNDVSCYTYRQL